MNSLPYQPDSHSILRRSQHAVNHNRVDRNLPRIQPKTDLMHRGEWRSELRLCRWLSCNILAIVETKPEIIVPLNARLIDNWLPEFKRQPISKLTHRCAARPYPVPHLNNALACRRDILPGGKLRASFVDTQ